MFVSDFVSCIIWAQYRDNNNKVRASQHSGKVK